MKLGAVRELWACTRTAFPGDSLHLAAAKLLECLIGDESDLLWDADTPRATRKEWAKLCSEALVVCDVGELETFWAKRAQSYSRMTYEDDVQSMVWSCFVGTWIADREAPLESAIILLGVPFE